MISLRHQFVSACTMCLSSCSLTACNRADYANHSTKFYVLCTEDSTVPNYVSRPGPVTLHLTLEFFLTVTKPLCEGFHLFSLITE